MTGRIVFFIIAKRQTVLAVCRLSSENQQAVCSAIKFRACTGFDGGFEVREAIRRLLDCVSTGKLNINADEKLALAA